MAKPFQFVAIALIAAVLGGAQCADWCAVFAPQPEKHPPCHQKQSTEQCAHHEIVAEQQIKAAITEPAVLGMAHAHLLFTPLLVKTELPRRASLEPDRRLAPVMTVLRL
jgi:hypothetical protein